MALGQALVDTLLIGSFYAATALGFSLVWGIMNIVNLAHGGFILVGAYVAYWLFQNFHIDPFIGIFAAMLSLFIMGYVVQYVAINRVIRAPLLVTFLFTFGLDLLIADILQRIFTGDQRSINVASAGMLIHVGGITLNDARIEAALIAVALTALLAFFLKHTRLGNAILATGMDRDAARLMGINIAQIYGLTFAIGAALAGAAGTLLGILQPFDPTLGGDLTRKAFIIVVLGGLGSPWAALAGGLVFAFVGNIAPVINLNLLSYTDALAFAVFLLVLFIRPRGLFGQSSFS